MHFVTVESCIRVGGPIFHGRTNFPQRNGGNLVQRTNFFWGPKLSWQGHLCEQGCLSLTILSSYFSWDKHRKDKDRLLLYRWEHLVAYILSWILMDTKKLLAYPLPLLNTKYTSHDVRWHSEDAQRYPKWRSTSMTSSNPEICHIYHAYAVYILSSEVLLEYHPRACSPRAIFNKTSMAGQLLYIAYVPHKHDI